MPKMMKNLMAKFLKELREVEQKNHVMKIELTRLEEENEMMKLEIGKLKPGNKLLVFVVVF